ncbi:MAG TPA: hypothetical protein VEG66_01995 [Thermoplasmata archaeon]|jgi:hypothetical protein|nr:hypothetical protein [Thermoplasmata archaeon]
MLGTDSPLARSDSVSHLSTVADVFRFRVAPCGLTPVRRLESLVERKLADVRRLEDAPTHSFAEQFDRVVEGVPTAQPYRSRIVFESPPAEVRAILRSGRQGYLGPAHLPEVADRLSGAPRDVRLDLASELLHGASPDRVALLARWVWNPSRRTGALAEFSASPADSHVKAQARLGELRLELETLGFPCATFGGVDVVLALTYAGRLQQTASDQLRSGGLESLLPGPFPLAAMILGVRRRVAHADR